MAVRLLVCLRLVNLTATKLKAFQERSLGTFMPFEGDLRGHSDYLNQVFTDMNRCIERNGWKQVRSWQEQMRDACRRLFLMPINELMEIIMKGGAGEEVLSSGF
jgi:hypothetical protein